MSNVNYSFTDKDSNGLLVFRSTVNSFGLDHVTDKDLLSFYANFSSNSYQDTGLLPVDGSGLLSIRSAGNHTQISYQHKPGMYYINWGQHERDANAKKYYIAQPYRIVIADLLNGNILGARTFYSPIPITHPQSPLYHVNLPNINCKGYRDNGVGWICLYHTEDISHYPFNEKLVKILDRCSGTEAYNDNNMSETDGPRFYRENNKPDYLTNPQAWEDYSDQNGYDWTLDPEIWIPVLVQDMDNQDKHYANGQPLTFADALIGNYQAYYTDTLIPKPINLIARADSSLQSSTVFTWFKQAYNNSATSSDQSLWNSFTSSLNVREKLSVAPPVFIADEDNDEDSNAWHCEVCEESFGEHHQSVSTYSEDYVCATCINEHFVYVNHLDSYAYTEECLYLDGSNSYIYIPKDLINGVDYKYCERCEHGVDHTHSDFQLKAFFHIDDDSEIYPDYSVVCKECLDIVLNDPDYHGKKIEYTEIESVSQISQGPTGPFTSITELLNNHLTQLLGEHELPF